MDRVELVSGSGVGHVIRGGNPTPTTVYVETDEEMGTAVTCGPHGGLQLTTITVAVPAPLSPSDPTAVLQAVAAAAAAAGPQHHQQQHHHQHHQQQHQQQQPTINLPTVPAPQESLKWKFDHSKDNKTSGGSSLVRGNSSKFSDEKARSRSF